MNGHVWLVFVYADVPDSVWTTRELAITRAAELDRDNNCLNFSIIDEFILDKLEGFV